MKSVLFLFLSVFLKGYCENNHDYNQFHSIDELIKFETQLIAEAPWQDYEAICDALIARGESYMVAKKPDLAIEDLQNAYDLAFYCKDREKRFELEFLSLFSLALGLDMAGKQMESVTCASKLIHIVDSYSCSKCSEKGNIPIRLTKVEIAGPDNLGPSWCVDAVRGTANSLEGLVNRYAKGFFAKAALFTCINHLTDQALYCCSKGTPWKTCVTPMLEKFQSWNQKWQVFGLPPDPAND